MDKIIVSTLDYCIPAQVQTGFGRMGSHFWGFDSHGVEPDIGKCIILKYIDLHIHIIMCSCHGKGNWEWLPLGCCCDHNW